MEASINYNQNTLSTNLVIADESKKFFAVLLSGSGKTIGQERYLEFQEFLKGQGVNSVSFDYEGSGKSTGNFNDYSLADRIDETFFIYKWLAEQYGEDTKIFLCGASMGAYVAVGVMHKIGLPVERLLLVCAAAYGSNAHAIKFGENFSREIRKADSWKKSLAFSWIESYQGQLLILTAENDRVVPSGIPNTYLNHSINTKSKEQLIIQKTEHNIAAFNSIKEPLKSDVIKRALSFFKI